MKEETLSVIKKLLRLATSSNQNESEQAMKRAQKMALENQIDISILDAFEEDKIKEEYVKTDIETNKRFSVCQRYINHLMGRYCGVTVLLTGNRYYGRQIILIGKKSDVEFATYVNDYLNKSFMASWRSYQKEFKIKTCERSSYLLGLFRGLDAKMTENKQEVIINKFEQLKKEKGIDPEISKSRYALTVKTDIENLEQAVNFHFPKVRSVKSKISCRNYSPSSLQAGMERGKQLNISRGLKENKILVLT